MRFYNSSSTRLQRLQTGSEIASLKDEIAYLNRKLTEDLERNIEVAKKKLKLGREKEKKRRDSLAMVLKKEREQTRLRTEKRIAELTGTVKEGGKRR